MRKDSPVLKAVEKDPKYEPWDILKSVCNKRTTTSLASSICDHPGNKGNRCTAPLCPIVPKLMKACWPKPPLYPHIESVDPGGER